MEDVENDKLLRVLDEEKRKLCADFRRKLSDILNREARVLGLIEHSTHDIEIYY